MGADGATSKVRSLAGIQSSTRDYNQRGLVATVEVSESNTTAWQRFLPTGPFALLPVRNGLFNIVWSTTSEVASAMESTNAEAAIQAFNEVPSQCQMSHLICVFPGIAWRSISLQHSTFIRSRCLSPSSQNHSHSWIHASFLSTETAAREQVR